jgi:hypothetical protein
MDGIRVVGTQLQQEIAVQPCGSGESLGNVPIGVSFFGLRARRPKRSSNRLDPMDTVTVSPSAGMAGPRTSLSGGGCPTPRSGGVRPEVRNRARLVSVRIRPARSALLSAMVSKAARHAKACLPAGSGVSTPAWWFPWNGYEPAADPRCAVPAVPAAAPLRKLRRLTFMAGLASAVRA